MPVAIITGAAVGFGRGLARVFGRAGYSLSLIDIRPELDELVEELRGQGVDVVGSIGDVTVDENLERLVDNTVTKHGTIDVLLNNAGQVRFTSVDLPTDDAVRAFDDLWRVNTRAPFLLGRLVIPHMIRAHSGHIVNIATDHIHTCGYPMTIGHHDSAGCAWSSSPRRPLGPGPFDAYDASKWALNGFTQNWSNELRRHGIRVNNICLGATDSEMMREAILVGRGRSATPEEIAGWMPTDAVADVVLQLHDEGPSGRSGDNVGIWLGHPIVLPPPHPLLSRSR